MKPWLVAILAVVVSAITGVATARWYFVRQIDTSLLSIRAAMQDKQEYTATISLTALTRLEAGETDRAKLILAQEIADYYHHPLGQSQPERQRLLTLIEAAGEKSPVLKDELRKTSK
jgi:hypothetical protein